MSSKADLVKVEINLELPQNYLVNCFTYTETYFITGRDGDRWMDGYNHNAVVWERGGAGKIVRKLEGHTDEVTCLDTTPCEEYVVTGSKDNTLILWKLSNGNRERSFVGHTGSVSAVVVTPSGDGIVSGSDDKTAILWNIHDSSRLLTFKGHEDVVCGVVVSSDGLHLYTCGSLDHKVIKWSMKTGDRLNTFEGRGWVHSCCLTSDDKYLITAFDRKVIIWNTDDATRLRMWKGHTSPIYSVCVSSDTRVIATGARMSDYNNEAVKLWDFHTAQPIGSRKAAKSICAMTDHSNLSWLVSVDISKDNRHLVTASWYNVIQYDISQFFKDIPARFVLLHCLRTFRGQSTAASTSVGCAEGRTRKRKRSERAAYNSNALSLDVSAKRVYRTFDDNHRVRYLLCWITRFF